MDDIFKTGEVSTVVVEDAGKTAGDHYRMCGLVEDGERGGLELSVGV